MAVNHSAVAEKVLNLLKGYGLVVKSFDTQGKLQIDPQEATRFVVADPNMLIRIDQTSDTLMYATGKNIDEETDNQLRGMLKNLANDYLMSFDYRKFNKTIKAKAENIDIAQKSEKDMADVMEGFGTMTGSTKTSYQPLDTVKIVVRHKKPVNEEVRGARSRNIHSIYIQRGEERFKMSENNLAAARAMARHMYNGGEMHDQTGTSITEMAGELNKLREFVRYVQSNNLVNEDNQNYVSLAFENIEHIKDTFKKLSGVKSYASAVNEVEKRSNIEMLEDDIDLEAKFTETHFDQRVEAVRDVIRTAMSRKSAFESSIDSAIKKESFDNLANMLSENDGIDFVSPRAKLGYQVSQLGSTVQNPQLGAYLSGISKKLQAGSHINQHEYTTIKSCLLGAHKTQPAVAVAESIDDKYEQFLEQFDIL
jgi:hypothetical protein